jgi:hypothetical protein
MKWLKMKPAMAKDSKASISAILKNKAQQRVSKSIAVSLKCGVAIVYVKRSLHDNSHGVCLMS